MILDTKIIKKTRKNVYKKYSVKWASYPEEEAAWMDEVEMNKHDTSLQEIISKGIEINQP